MSTEFSAITAGTLSTHHYCWWRRGWDLNPRWSFPHSGFRDRCTKPLCDLSELSEPPASAGGFKRTHHSSQINATPHAGGFWLLPPAHAGGSDFCHPLTQVVLT